MSGSALVNQSKVRRRASTVSSGRKVDMRKNQLQDALRGVDLLLAHLKETPDDFVAMMKSGNVEGARACADPLLTVATILTRMLRDSRQMTTAAAQQFIRQLVFDYDLSDDADTMRDMENVENLISTIIGARKPLPIATDPLMVSLLAQGIASAAAKEIAKQSVQHVNAVVAGLRTKLKDQGEDVQLSDGDAARAVAIENAYDPDMRKARQTTTYSLVKIWNDAGNTIHTIFSDQALVENHQKSIFAIESIAFACGALAAGIYQLASEGNLYPAAALLRQVVEVEFILWKFTQDTQQPQAWIESTPDERRANWRPSTIYRDNNNAYRQKDYSNHCELGGHPTPLGTKVACGLAELRTIEANILADLVGHCNDAWQHLMASTRLLDSEYKTDLASELLDLDRQHESLMADHSSRDQYAMSTAFFSDPID